MCIYIYIYIYISRCPYPCPARPRAQSQRGSGDLLDDIMSKWVACVYIMCYIRSYGIIIVKGRSPSRERKDLLESAAPMASRFLITATLPTIKQGIPL